MFCPAILSPEARKKAQEASRELQETFQREQPFLSTFFGLVSVLAQLAFWIAGLFIVIFFLF